MIHLLSNSLVLLAARDSLYMFRRHFAALIHAKTDVEKAIATKLSEGIKSADTIRVQDTSGGCGSFYKIEVMASEFEGQSTIKQHRLVCSVLEEEMKAWHGANIVTKAK